MKTDELKVNQLSPKAYEWYLAYLTAMDNLDIDAYAAFLAEDCEMQFGNTPIVKGKKNIVEALTAFWATVEGDEHNLQNIFGNDNNFVLEALNTFKRKDGKTVTIPAVAITEKNLEGLVTSVRLFMDVAPIFT
jgi:ketosteroid isomerase-like protein